MITIKKIIWFGEQEADVLITDGTFELICFSHPCRLKEEQTIDACIGALNSKNIMRSFDNSYYIKKLSGPYNYQLTGKLLNKSKGIIIIGNICIETGGYIPNDIEEGEFISFECNRLDIS